MNNIGCALDYWNSFEPIDRESILENIHIDKELAGRDFYKLPGFIRMYFYNNWQKLNKLRELEP